MSLKMLQLMDVAKRLVDTLIEVKPWEHVLIVTDPTVDASVDDAMAGVFKAAGAKEVYLLTITPREVSNGRPPPLMREALKAADVFIMHTRYDMHALEISLMKVNHGMRMLYMPALTADQMVHPMVSCIDYEAFRKYNLELGIKMYEDVKTLRITDKLGTDFTTDVKGAEVAKYNREELKKPITLCREPGGMGVLPAGDTAGVKVVPFTANGIAVFESYVMFGRLTQPMRMTIKNGYVTKIEGGYEARILRKLFNERKDTDHLVHVSGPGTNPYCGYSGLPDVLVMEDKRSEGPLHIGFGTGPKLGKEMHSDGIIYKPTIEADGKIVEEDGLIKFPLFKG